MPYLILAVTGATILLLIFVSYRLAVTKDKLSLINAEGQRLSLLVEKLNSEKLHDTETIATLRAKIEYLERASIDLDKQRQEAFATAKASLYDLGNNLSKQLIDLHKKENAENRKLSDESLIKTTEKFHREFERITNNLAKLDTDVKDYKDTIDVVKNSLLNPSGAGALAEITLENILKSSGLRTNTDYIMQYHIAESAKLRPDAVIFLPGNNIMVVDAKASKFLLEMHHSNSTESVEISKQNFKKTINNHLKSLATKDYKENILEHFASKQIQHNNIMTLMFLPTEQAVERAVEVDPGFIHRAWGLNIFPVGPSGLMNMLSFAKFQISDNLRAENYKMILEEVRKLLASTVSLSDHARKMGGNLQSMVQNYDKFAASFNRNFLSKAQNIAQLGVEVPSNKNLAISLERYQLVSSKSDLIEIDEEKPQLIEK